MAYRYDKNDKSLVIDGWENGVADTPYAGAGDMRNADISSERGEVSVVFANEAVTMPPVVDATAYTATASTDRLAISDASAFYEGVAVVLASNTATGLSDSIVYYVRNISGNTFQLSLKPAAPIVDITGDGTGTLTTYQYGNQRGLTNNGSPVSYWEAPEVGGVFMVDLSNYVWFWAQEDGNIVAKNHIIFMGNITGMAAASNNQTGIAFWGGYVMLLQQLGYVNTLSWERFISEYDGNYIVVTATRAVDIFTIEATGEATSDLFMQTLSFAPAQYVTTKPEILSTTYTSADASSATITSGSISVKEGDTVLIYAFTYNNQTVASATFNGNAMTPVYADNGTAPWNFGLGYLSYTAPSDMTGTAIATYGGAVTDRFIYTYIIRNQGTLSDLSDRYEVDSASITQNIDRRNPNVLTLINLMDNTAAEIGFSENVTTLGSRNTVNAGSYTNWTGFYSDYWDASETLKKNVPVCVGTNNILYWGNGHQYLASIATNPDQEFNPFQSTSISSSTSGGGSITTITTTGFTYNINNAALDLPDYERIESLEMAGGTLYMGTISNNIYPWDTISPSFDFPVVFPEFAVVDFVASNQLLYTFGGNLGRIYLTNNASASLHKELPHSVTGGEKPYFFFWDANVGNSELYFTFQAFPNGSTTALTTTGGIWATNADSNALRLVQSPLNGYSALTRMGVPVGNGASQTILRPDGQGLLMGYTIGSNHYLEYSITTPYTGYSTAIETEIIPVGTFFTNHTFEHIEYKLGAPMVAGEGIKIYQRSNLNDTYTEIAEFTTAGLVSDESSINWENVQWLQLKIEMKSTDTDPSFVRLREIRIR